ncbi:MAG: ACT domain-containing protein [Christensenella sp.]|nr:ACT domain-containing protein [Christensenella sp.]
MEIAVFQGVYAVGLLDHIPQHLPKTGFCSISVGEDEVSLVCREESMPEYSSHIQRGYRLFRIQGTLDFSLIGVIAKISAVLAKEKIPLFCVSTYRTDYFLVEEIYLQRALAALQNAGYRIMK